jgi:hypothetical protein
VTRRLEKARDRATALWSEPLARVLVIVLALALALTVTALALLVPSRTATPVSMRGPIVATSSLLPTTALFGDRVSAEIAVYTSKKQIDPGSVRVRTDFRPYRVVETEVVRSSQGPVSLLRTRLVLQCLTSACLPRAGRDRMFRFPSATVTYRQGTTRVRQVEPWGALQVYSRLTSQPPRLDEEPPSLDTGTRISPTVLRTALAGLAAALGLVGAWLVISGLWPRFFYSTRRWRRLSPLEQALAQLDAAARIDDEEVRRRVLDQLATRLGEADLVALERHSRTLAWEAGSPETEALDHLGELVRSSVNGGSRQ